MLTFKERKKLDTFIQKNLNVKCKCGHSVDVYDIKTICTHCGRYVFKNKEDEFKYRLNEKINKEK